MINTFNYAVGLTSSDVHVLCNALDAYIKEQEKAYKATQGFCLYTAPMCLKNIKEAVRLKTVFINL